MFLKYLLETRNTWGKGRTSRTDFKETWLMESPIRIAPANYYPTIVNDIEEFKRYGLSVIDLGSGLKKITLSVSAIYWMENKNGNIEIGMELDKRP